MQDLVNTIVLICAAIAALGLGVVIAYVICNAGFTALRLHARSMTPETPPAKPRTAQV